LLNKTQPTAQFIISIKDQTEVTVLVNEISGHVKLRVIDQDKKTVACTNTFQQRISCNFKTSKNSNYTVKV
jgi:hypothetical protein